MRKRALVLLLVVTALYSFRRGYTPRLYDFGTLRNFPAMPVAADNLVTEEGALLGRYLFYDPALSRDSSIACAGCHRQEAAFSDGPNALSKGINGSFQKRNTLPLFNLAWYPRLFWDGRSSGIEEHVSHPLLAADEMNISWRQAIRRLSNNRLYRAMFNRAFGNEVIDSARITKAIAQFERTLISYNSKYDKALRGEASFTEDEFEGLNLVNDMTKADCLQCHSTDADALGTIPGFSNNGLDKAREHEDYKDKGAGGFTSKTEDVGKFKIPSLRNLAFTAPYMHDGRFETLEKVIEFYSEGVHLSLNIDPRMATAHRGGSHLTSEEKRQVLAFILTMSDSTFVRDKAFSNPFTERKTITRK
jgi:cytochrome c peroxidase